MGKFTVLTIEDVVHALDCMEEKDFLSAFAACLADMDTVEINRMTADGRTLFGVTFGECKHLKFPPAELLLMQRKDFIPTQADLELVRKKESLLPSYTYDPELSCTLETLEGAIKRAEQIALLSTENELRQAAYKEAGLKTIPFIKTEELEERPGFRAKLGRRFMKVASGEHPLHYGYEPLPEDVEARLNMLRDMRDVTVARAAPASDLGIDLVA